jgi:hypothetical protein
MVYVGRNVDVIRAAGAGSAQICRACEQLRLAQSCPREGELRVGQQHVWPVRRGAVFPALASAP